MGTMVYCTLLFACTLVSALQVDLQKVPRVVPTLEAKSLLQSRDDGQNSLLLFRRTPTKPSPPGKTESGPSNKGMRRSKSHPDLLNLGVNGGSVKAKPWRSNKQARPRTAQGSLLSDGLQRDYTSNSSGRTIRYESRSRSGGSLAEWADRSSSSGGTTRSHSSQSLSLASDSSPPGHGIRGFLHDSNLANSPRTTQSSLAGSSPVLSPVGSLRSQRSSIDESMGGSVLRSTRAHSPATPRNSVSSSMGYPSPLGSTVTQPSVLGTPSSISTQRDSDFNLLRIHDSPSSIPRARTIADSLGRNIRPRLHSTLQQNQQISPESPASRIGSMVGEVGSLQGASLDPYLDAESLGLRFQRMRFG